MTGGTGEVGGPTGELRNTSHDICRGLFSLSLFLSPLTDAFDPATRMKQDYEATTMRGDTDEGRYDEEGRKRQRGRRNGPEVHHEVNHSMVRFAVFLFQYPADIFPRDTQPIDNA